MLACVSTSCPEPAGSGGLCHFQSGLSCRRQNSIQNWPFPWQPQPEYSSTRSQHNVNSGNTAVMLCSVPEEVKTSLQQSCCRALWEGHRLHLYEGMRETQSNITIKTCDLCLFSKENMFAREGSHQEARCLLDRQLRLLIMIDKISNHISKANNLLAILLKVKILCRACDL